MSDHRGFLNRDDLSDAEARDAMSEASYTQGPSMIPGELRDHWAAGTSAWVRFVRNAATGDLDFYYSLDPPSTNPDSVSWTQVGTTTAGQSGGTREAMGNPLFNHGGGDEIQSDESRCMASFDPDLTAEIVEADDE